MIESDAIPVPVEQTPTTVSLALRDNNTGAVVRRAIIAQATGTPGLYVVPQYLDHTLTGWWQVVHESSGCSVPGDPGNTWAGVDLHTAVRIANALGHVGIDWTRDKDTVVASYHDNEAKRAEIRDAIRAGRYPKVDPVTREAPGSYPRTAADVTTHRLLSYLTASALHRNADVTTSVGHSPDNVHARCLWATAAAALVAEYGLVAVLRAFHTVDPDAADTVARDVWDAWEDGGAIGEQLRVWGVEYGLAAPERGNPANLGVTMPGPLTYEQVLAKPLPEAGTVGELRRGIARAAQHNQGRYRELADREIAVEHHSGDVLPLTPDESRERRNAGAGSVAGWSLVAVLGWLAREYPPLAVRAAAVVEDVSVNGDLDYCTDALSAGPEGGGETSANGTTPQ